MKANYTVEELIEIGETYLGRNSDYDSWLPSDWPSRFNWTVLALLKLLKDKDA